MKCTIFFIIPLICILHTSFSRSPFRSPDPTMPEITTQWTTENTQYRLKSYYLQEEALFKKFDKGHMMSHLLPKDDISYRYEPDKKIPGAILSDLAETLLVEIKQRKKNYTHFSILKDDDFNHRTGAGSLIVKFKDYPFVLKLFIETPQTFVRPFSKGFVNTVFFVMGGATRYMSGFLRIKNLEAAQNMITHDPYWADKVGFPRKWFWLPSEAKWFYVHTKNIGACGEQTIELPSAYAVIADLIRFKDAFSIFNAEERKTAIAITNALGNRIDPNIGNFVYEEPHAQGAAHAISATSSDAPTPGKNSANPAIPKDNLTASAVNDQRQEATEATVDATIDKTIVIIDTEHFPTMLGIRKPLRFESYTSWYMQISGKCANDWFGKTKAERRVLQTNPQQVIMPC